MPKHVDIIIEKPADPTPFAEHAAQVGTNYWRAVLSDGTTVYSGTSRKLAVAALLAGGPGAVIKSKVHCRVEPTTRLSIVR